MTFLSVSSIKQWLKISGNADDTVITTIGDIAEARVNNYLNRALAFNDYEELLDGTGLPIIVPSNYPIIEIVRLEVYDGLDVNGGELWTEWQQSRDYDRLIIATNKQYIKIDGAVFPRGDANIRLTYKAGYDSIALPKDIYHVLLDLCYLYYHAIRAESNLGKSSDIQVSGGGVNTSINYDIEAEARILQRIITYKKSNV